MVSEQRMASTRPRLTRLVIRLGDAYRRLLGVLLVLAGPRIAYAATGGLARLFYRLVGADRMPNEAQCRAALTGRLSDHDIPRVAEMSFVHRAWNLTDLMLADRLLHPGTYRRYGGQIPECERDRLLSAQRRKQPLILLTAYYGPYDLLPLFLGFNGLRATMPYRPHPNRSYDHYRQRIRSRSGCELVPLGEATGGLQDALEAGGTIALVADHHAERKGVETTFLGMPTQAMRSVGLLAHRYGADIVVAGIRRKTEPFRFAFVVTDIVDHHTWTDLDDPVPFITERYLRALEELVLGDPAQYLWGHLRWGAELPAFAVSDAR